MGSNNGIDLSLLPPCTSALKKHCYRANYQAFIWKHAHENLLQVPEPNGNGWCVDDSGNLQIDWLEGDVLPQSIVDIINHEPDQIIEEDDVVDNILDLIFQDDVDEDVMEISS